jgi:hypothetical protein
MFTNPTTDRQKARTYEQEQREHIYQTADAIYRACAEQADAAVTDALLRQLATLTSQPRHS